jgi:hypothetical protein
MDDLDLFKSINELGDMSPEKIRRFYQLKDMIKFAQHKSENKKVKQDQLAKMMGTSKSILQRTRKDLNLPSFYRHDTPTNTKKPVELSEIEISTLRSANLSDAEKERLNQYTTKQKQKEMEKQTVEGNHRVTLRDLKNRCIELYDNTPTVSKPIKGKTITTSRNKTAKHEVNPSAGSLEKPVIDGDYLDNLLPKT